MRSVRLLSLAVLSLLAGYLLLRESPRDQVDTASSDRPLLVQGVAIDLDSVRVWRTAVLKRIDQSATYLPQILADGDSALKRWPDRTSDPLRVYLPTSTVAGYQVQFDQAVREAFGRWMRVGGIPVHFVYVRDSALADIQVRWIDHFAMRRTGQADVVWNQLGWLASGTLTLATHVPDGRPLPRDGVYTVALHEIGHLLGIGHSDDPNDVMYPFTSVHDLTPRDKRTADLLYVLPPGSLRSPPARR